MLFSSNMFRIDHSLISLITAQGKWRIPQFAPSGQNINLFLLFYSPSQVKTNLIC